MNNKTTSDLLNRLFSTIKTIDLSLSDNILEVCFVDNLVIKDLNKKFFGNNSITDILTFANKFPLSNSLGEVIINTDYLTDKTSKLFPGLLISKNKESLTDFDNDILISQNFSISSSVNNIIINDYFVKLFIHGILHLRSYDHINTTKQKIMFLKENDYHKKIIESLQSNN